jgi:hypothetical protein
MTEREFDHSRMENALRSLARAIDYPETPDLAPAVRARIEARPTATRAGLLQRAEMGFRRAALALRQPAFAATAIVVIASVFLMMSPAARIAVADWLGFDDVRVSFDDPPVRPVGGELRLGRHVTLSEARSAVSFDVLVPEELGAPDEVYYNSFVSEGQVTLVYRARDDLPRARGTRVGAIVTQFEANFLDQQFYEKFVRSSTTVQEVPVAGVRGLWINQPHALIFRGADGSIDNEDSRLSVPSLVWEKDGILFRLESSLSLQRAVAAAESLR